MVLTLAKYVQFSCSNILKISKFSHFLSQSCFFTPVNEEEAGKKKDMMLIKTKSSCPTLLKEGVSLRHT